MPRWSRAPSGSTTPDARLVIGTDPTGKTVRSGDTARALELRANGITVRGIGIRRYSTSNPDMGTVTLEKTNATLENVIISDSATIGLFIGSSGATIRKVTVENAGMLGVLTNFSDNLKVDGLKVTGGNTERFNMAPAGGGFKLSRSRGVTIQNSDISSNGATGIWFDVSCFQVAVTGSRVQGNALHGIFFEISSRGIFSGNLVKDNAGHGFKINNSSMSILTRNVVSGSGDGNIVMLQDPRTPGSSYGADSRYPGRPRDDLAEHQRPGHPEHDDRDEPHPAALVAGLHEHPQLGAAGQRHERQPLRPHQQPPGDALQVQHHEDRRHSVHHLDRVPGSDRPGSGGSGSRGESRHSAAGRQLAELGDDDVPDDRGELTGATISPRGAGRIIPAVLGGGGPRR